MRIINPQVKQDIDSQRLLKIDLGNGGKSRQGFYGIDCLELKNVDIVADLNEALDLLPDNCVEHLISNHCLEHIENLMLLMKEIHRIVKPEGVIEIVVPHFSSPYFYSDPTHVRFFGLYTMYYFVSREKQPQVREVPTFYSDTKFNITQIKIQFNRRTFLDKLIAHPMAKLVNRNLYWQDFYESKLSGLFRASIISYIMSPDK